jgi:GT2 family glycosyltransferase
MSPGPSIAIVIPAYDAAATLERVLPAARRAAGAGDLLVVDAGSGDATAERAAALGARVIRLARRAGPAEARNLGARSVDAEVVLFLDADCVPRADVVERVARAFSAEPDLVGLSGSYDDAPDHPGFFSRYMNLRHHCTHQLARREPASFWAGCGAVRRSAFLAAGGFDAERFPRPEIEDIELSVRLAAHGRTRLDPELQVKHLKRWTLRSVVETDVLRRAAPWARLILERGELPDDLNLRRSQRLAAALAPLALASVALAPAAALAGSGRWLAACAACVAASLAVSFDLVRCFARAGGPGFAAGAWLFHQVHLIYSAATFAVCALRHRWRPHGTGAA